MSWFPEDNKAMMTSDELAEFTHGEFKRTCDKLSALTTWPTTSSLKKRWLRQEGRFSSNGSVKKERKRKSVKL